MSHAGASLAQNGAAVGVPVSVQRPRSRGGRVLRPL